MQAQQLEGIIADRFEITQRLARGGMSEIYLACDRLTGQTVAVKLVHQKAGEYCERFRREVQTIAQLEHENVLPAITYGEYKSWYYLITPYIEYGTLYNRLRGGPLTPLEVGEILAQLAGALQCAHDHGVVHRDIKPSNVLLFEGTHVYLADFGLVKNAGSSHSLTRSGYLIGTPEYMAPELVDLPATVASDVYALGILLYQMLAGRVPFKGATPVMTVWKHIQEAPERPSLANPAVPPAVEQVVLRALAKEPRERFASAAELAQAYQQALELDDRTLPRLAAVPTPEAAIRVVPLSSVPTSREKFYIRVALLSAAFLLVFAVVLLALLSGK